MLKVFLNTWGNYNENGADGGQWVTLPLTPEELEERKEKIAQAIGDNDPEWAIHDYEWESDIYSREISECENLEALNDELNDLATLDEYELKEIAAAVEAFGYDFAEAKERQERGCFIFYAGMSLEDVAYELVEECYFTEKTPDIFKTYFDYTAFARDLGFDGHHETTYGVILDN